MDHTAAATTGHGTWPPTCRCSRGAGLWDLPESREAIPMMLVPVANRVGEDLKPGIDDFLVPDGTWDDLLDMLEPKLPEPEQPDA